MTIEHAVLRSQDPTRGNDYSNCLYACRLCNRARGTTPREALGATLIDPTAAAWGDWFEVRGDCLVPKAGSPAAQYTWEIYDLDDPRKVKRRQARRQFIADRMRFLEDLPAMRARFARCAADRLADGDVEGALECHEEMRSFLRAAEGFRKELARYSAIADDRDVGCRCGASVEQCLPEFLEEQTRDMPGDLWPGRWREGHAHRLTARRWCVGCADGCRTTRGREEAVETGASARR